MAKIKHSNKGAYIMYVWGGPEGFTNFSKNFLAQETIDHRLFHGPVIFSENISWPLPSILVSYLRLTCSSISGKYSNSNYSNSKYSYSVIFKFQIAKEVNIYNNVQKIIFE